MWIFLVVNVLQIRNACYWIADGTVARSRRQALAEVMLHATEFHRSNDIILENNDIIFDHKVKFEIRVRDVLHFLYCVS